MSPPAAYPYTDLNHEDYRQSVANSVHAMKENRCPQFRTILVLITSVFINIILVLVLDVRQSEKNSPDSEDTSDVLKIAERMDNSVCSECHVLGLSRHQPSFSKSVSLLSLRDGHLCCLPGTKSILRLFNLLYMKMRMKQLKEANNSPSFRLPSAHLYLDTLEDKNYKWSEEYGFGAAHVIKPIQLKNGRLYIEKGGYYNIYSFITLKRRKDLTSPTTIKHSVIRICIHTVPHAGVILQNGVELPRQSETFTTSYLSGVVKLQSKDELYVDVSDVNSIYRFAPSNFFGLHLVKYL